MTWGHGGRARPRKYSYDDQKVVFDLVTEVRQARNCTTAEALVATGVTLTRFQCARQALAKGRSPDDPPGTRMDRSHDAAYRRLLKREPPGGMPAASSAAVSSAGVGNGDEEAENREQDAPEADDQAEEGAEPASASAGESGGQDDDPEDENGDGGDQGGGAPAELVRCFVIEGSAAAVRHVLEVFLGA